MSSLIINIYIVILIMVWNGFAGLTGDKKFQRARQVAFELILPADLAMIYNALPDSAARANWEEKYWRMKDPTPSTPTNPYKEEFEERFAFAWKNYSNLVGPLFLDDRAKYYLKYGAPDDFVESIGMGMRRSYLDNLTWAYYGLNLFIDFVKRTGFGYQEVDDLSEAITGAPLNVKIKRAAELYAERETLHQRYASFRRAARYTSDYFTVASEIAQEKSLMLSKAPPCKYSFRYSQEPLNAQLRSACFREENGLTRLEVYYSVPLREIQFIEGDRYPLVSHLEKSFSLFDRDYQPLLQKHKRIELAAATREEQKTRLYVNQHNEIVEPGLYNLALELENPEGNRLAVLKTQLKAKDFSAESLMVSDLQFSSQVIEEGKGKYLKPNDILVIPYVPYQINKNKPIYIYFEIYNLSLNEKHSTEYQVEYVIRTLERPTNNLLNRFSKIVSFLGGGKKSESVAASFVSRGRTPFEQRYLMLDMSSCPAGRTQLQVNITDRVSNQRASSRISFFLQ